MIGRMGRSARIAGAIVLVLAASAALLAYLGYRQVVGGDPIFETDPPPLPAWIGSDGRPAVLVFSKTSGYRHVEAIPACRAALEEIAGRRGWALFATENGATFRPDYLERFDAVFFNNVSGDVFTPEQRAALRAWVEVGGGFVGVHGSGGDFAYDWRWYVEQLIGAQFAGHVMTPQFQTATVRVADREHPATRDLAPSWEHHEEWYSFEASPRRRGVRVLATVDESTYDPSAWWGWQDLSMGDDHPVIWSHCVGRGRSLYSALGHQAAAYASPEYRRVLEGAIAWAAGLEGGACTHPIAAP